MSAQLPVARQSLGRTFMVAAVVLGLVGLVQFVAVGVKFFQTPPAVSAGEDQGSVRRPPEKIDIQKLMTDLPPPDEPETPPLAANDPLAADAVTISPSGIRPVPIATPLEPRPVPEPRPRGEASVPSPFRQGVPARPTPVPLTALTPKVSPQFTELIEQGKLLRNSGDTAGALVKFREASALEPTNAQAMAEQAYTYEKMSLHDKAAEQWRRVLALGENAGVLYSAARSKLDMAVAEAVRGSGSSGRPLGEGKILGLGSIAMQPDADPASARKFVLSVPIRARAGERVNVRDMKIFVLFYDRLDGRDLTDTAANISNRWSDPPANWADGDTEVLEVSYDLPASEAQGGHRAYYGYVVRVYYAGSLQATHAEPAELNQRFPADPTLTE